MSTNINIKGHILMVLGCAKLLQKRYPFFLCNSANWKSRQHLRINLSIRLFCIHNVSAKKETKWQLFAVYLVNTQHSSNKCSLSNLSKCFTVHLSIWCPDFAADWWKGAEGCSDHTYGLRTCEKHLWTANKLCFLVS